MIALTTNSAESQTIQYSNDVTAKPQQTSSSEVYSCLDIINNINTNDYRSNYIAADDNTGKTTVKTTYHPLIYLKFSDHYRTHWEAFAKLVDKKDLINYSRDTIYIEESYPDTWNGCCDYREHYFMTIKTKKGIYDLKRKKLIRRIYKNAQERLEKDSINPDALPGSYEWEMLRYRCWDDNMMFKYFGELVNGYTINFIRIVIKDNAIVYCDRWLW